MEHSERWGPDKYSWGESQRQQPDRQSGKSLIPLQLKYFFTQLFCVSCAREQDERVVCKGKRWQGDRRHCPNSEGCPTKVSRVMGTAICQPHHSDNPMWWSRYKDRAMVSTVRWKQKSEVLKVSKTEAQLSKIFLHHLDMQHWNHQNLCQATLWLVECLRLVVGPATTHSWNAEANLWVNPASAHTWVFG